MNNCPFLKFPLLLGFYNKIWWQKYVDLVIIAYLFLVKRWGQPITKIMYQLVSSLWPLFEWPAFGAWEEGGSGLSGGEAGRLWGGIADPFSEASLPHKGCGKETSLGSSCWYQELFGVVVSCFQWEASLIFSDEYLLCPIDIQESSSQKRCVVIYSCSMSTNKNSQT